MQYADYTTGADLLEKTKVHHDLGKSILVIGHTNNLPIIIKKFGVLQPLQNIPERNLIIYLL